MTEKQRVFLRLYQNQVNGNMSISTTYIPFDMCQMFRVINYADTNSDNQIYRVVAVVNDNAEDSGISLCSPEFSSQEEADTFLADLLSGQHLITTKVDQQLNTTDLSEFVFQLNELSRRVYELEQAVMYAPGGFVYRNAEADFNQHRTEGKNTQ